MVSKERLLRALPPVQNKLQLINPDQDVGDIMKEVCDAHRRYQKDYDYIYRFFDYGDTEETAREIFDFCKKDFVYNAEKKKKQTTRSPGALLTTAATMGADCKQYAGFVAGVLDAIKRNTGQPIDWKYRFASYNYDDINEPPQHVFVVVKNNGREFWIDPVLGRLDQRDPKPFYHIDRKVKTMALYTMSGIGFVDNITLNDFASQELQPVVTETGVPEVDPNLTPQVEDNLKILLYYGVMNDEAQINDDRLIELAGQLPREDYEKIWMAYQDTLEKGTVGGLFTNIWRGVKKVTLAAPRNAYLSLVALNIFGLGTKLDKILFKPNGGGYYDDAKKKLYDLWTYKLGGSFPALEGAIKAGRTKKAVLGCTMRECAESGAISGPEAVAAWVAVASSVIAALAPLIKQLTQQRQSEGINIDIPGVDPATGLPYQYGGGGLWDWIKNNPLIAGILGLGLGYGAYRLFFSGSSKRQAA